MATKEARAAKQQGRAPRSLWRVYCAGHGGITVKLTAYEAYKFGATYQCKVCKGSFTIEPIIMH